MCSPGAVKAGSPSIGTDLSDDHIWYYNGTSAAQVLVALDYVLPTFAPFHKPDLVVYGPNFGWTLGPLPYTFSDNLGPAIVAIERGIPAIAFSTGNPVSALYTWVNDTTEVNLPDPATVTARLASRLIQTMYSKAEGKPFLPQGYGISVNMPFITTFTSDTCIDPPFVLVRSTGTATDTVKYDSNTGLFESTLVGGGAATTEHGIVNTNCTSLITAFTVQYDGSHGQCINATDASTLLVPVVIQLNNTAPGKGSGGSVVVVGNSTDPKGVPSAVQPPMGIPGLGVKNQWSLGLLMVCFGVAAFLL